MDAVEVNDSPPNEQNIVTSVEICRVCLLGNVLMRDLFLENGITSLSVKAMSFANVKMMPGDGLPTHVCTDCADKLESAYEFKLQVEHADNVLREKYDTLSVKEELFFNEVEVNLEGDRTDSIGDMDIQQNYQHSSQSLDSDNEKSLLKDQYELLQMEKLVQNESLEQENDNADSLEQEIVGNSSNNNIQGKLRTEDECTLMVNSGDRESLKLVPCVDAIPAEEHDYIMQQQYIVQEPLSIETPTKPAESKETQEDCSMEVSPNENNERKDDVSSVKHEETVEEEQPKNESRKSKRKSSRRVERDSDDEENYFENLNLSSRLKRAQVDKSEKVYFVCYLCDKQFLSKSVLKEHMHSHEEIRRALSLKKTPEKQQKASPRMPSSGKRANKCPHCGKEYLYLISFSKHLKQHEREKEESKEDDTSFELLYQEDEEVVEQRDSDSEYGRSTEDAAAVNEEKERDHEHLKRKLRRKSRSIFECDKCSDKFPSRSSLRRHELLAHTVKCNVCEEEFERLEDLRDHRAKHVVEGVLTEQDLEADGEEQHEDEIDNVKDVDRPLDESEIQDGENRCDMDEETIENATYEGGADEEEYYYDDYDGGGGDVSGGGGGEEIETTVASLVEEDKDSFMDKDELKCIYCSLECTSKRALSRHMLMHSENKCTCKICGQEFARKDELRRHVEQHGARMKSFKCIQCNKTFGHELTLRNHLIATNHKTFVHGQEYDPNKRIKRVAAKAAQKIIDKIKTEDDFEDYEDERNDMTHDSADVYYSRKRESLTKNRQGRKDLECATCNKKCTSKQSLAKHMEQHAKEERLDMPEKGKDGIDRKEHQQRIMNDTSEIHDTKYVSARDDRQTSDDNSDFESGLDWPMDNYECATCKKRYSTKKSLLRHQLLHEEPNFECDICNVKFYRKDKLKAHYDKCSEKNPDQVRKCNICGDSFENNEMLRQHRSKHVTEGILTEEDLRDIEPRAEERKQGEKVARKRRTDIVGLECTECNKRYTSRKGLLRHIQVHEGKKYLCDICPKKFYRREHLKIHVAKHNMIKPYKCTRCTKRFIKEDQLTSHLSKHDRSFKKSKETDSSKRFLCEICSKSFTQSTTLIAHLRAHNGIKPYVCEVCSRPFTTNAYLKMHMRTHTQEKPYICQYCSRAFARADTLANHLTSHTGEAKYHCKYCPKNFRRLKSLKEHVFIHTGQRPYACPTCDRRFNNNGSRYAHSKRCKQNLLQSQARNNQQQQQQQQSQMEQLDPQTQQQFQQPQRIQQQEGVVQAPQLVKAQNIKTITIARQTETVGATQQIMQHQEILMPLILPLTVTLADVGEEVILPEDTKIFTTS